MPDDPAVELYRLPLDEFTTARERLAKELRRAGDSDAAAAVRSLRRPANAAWALNRIAVDSPEVVATVLDAGRHLHDATAAGDRPAIIDATRAERAARDAAAEAAMAALRDAELPTGGAVRQQVLDTLHAAVVDDDVASQLRRGTLDKAYASSGFDFGAGAAGAAAPKPAPKKAAKQTKEAAAEERAKVEAARAAAKARAQRAAEAERAAKRAARLDHDADVAEAHAAEARRAAVEAHTEADELASLVDPAS
ncbi:MAG: hypothetical protein QOG39_923 [Acidimicrobiaceae bacterium]